jgi:hypothetical protein
MGVRLNGATSGFVELNAPAVAGTTTLELPTDSIKPALVLVATSPFTAASTVNVNNCFTSTYDNYRVQVIITASGGGDLLMRMRASGTDNTAASYFRRGWYNNNGGSGAMNTISGTFFNLSFTAAAGVSHAAFDISSPALAQRTVLVGQSMTPYSGGMSGEVFGQVHDTTSIFDGLTVYPASSTITGTVSIYGYRKAL